MKQRRPVCLGLVICVAAMGLASCQGLSGGNLLGTPQAAPPPSCTVVNDDGRMKNLQAENVKLKKQLADAMRDNAMLRDLAVKKW